MKSNTKKDLVIITNVEENKFYKKIKEKTKFENDERIKFVGTVYDQELLTSIRKNAYGLLKIDILNLKLTIFLELKIQTLF